MIDRNTIIGFDAKRIVSNNTGLGSYSRTLVNDLAAATEARLLLFAPTSGRTELRRQIAERENVEFVYPRYLFDNRLWHKLAGSRWRSAGMVDDLAKHNVALFHGLSGELPKGLKASGTASVVTIHDLIFLRHPEFYNPIDVAIYRRKFLRTLAEADRIIAISECTKRDILHYGEFAEDKISVIYQSCGTRFGAPVTEFELQEAARRYHLPEQYMLCVGTIEERKNAALAVKALPLLPRQLHLVVLGRPTKYKKVVENEAMRLGVADRLHFLHGVANDHLAAIYRQADCFVYPSRYEGFGIPIIEAIQSGLPVVAATGSCLEEAGGPDSLYVSPDDAEALAAAVVRSIDERQMRVERSRNYVKRFENTGVARQVMGIYEDLLSRK